MSYHHQDDVMGFCGDYRHPWGCQDDPNPDEQTDPKEDGVAILNRAIRELAAMLSTPEAEALHRANCAAFGIRYRPKERNGEWATYSRDYLGQHSPLTNADIDRDRGDQIVGQLEAAMDECVWDRGEVCRDDACHLTCRHGFAV
jgi:hypothetical protein